MVRLVVTRLHPSITIVHLQYKIQLSAFDEPINVPFMPVKNTNVYT